MDKYQIKVRDYHDSFLLKTRNQNKVAHKFMTVCALVFIPCGGLFFYLGSTSNDGYLSLVATISLVVGIMCAFLAVDCYKLAHAANVEITRRGMESQVAQGYEKASNGLKKALLVWVAVVLGVLVIFGVAALSSDTGGSSNSVRCPNCKTEYREEHAADFIKKYGYCTYCNGKKWG